MAATAGAFAFWGLVPLYWKLVAHLPATEVLAHRIAWLIFWKLAPELLLLLAIWYSSFRPDRTVPLLER